MKKSAIALAVMCSAGGADAQSTVTLFGVVDAAISKYSVKSSPYNASPFAISSLTPQPSERRSQTALSINGYNPSRIGFRGTEDLGGGLAASFWLEAPVANDTGGATRSFARRSTISLSGPFGELRLGRDYAAHFWNDSVFDPFAANGVGSSLIFLTAMNLQGLRGPGGIAPSDNYVRTSNSVGYLLPAGLGGFYGQVQYTFHENVSESSVPGSPSRRGQYYGARFGYASGPIDAAVSFGENTASDATLATGANVTDKIRTINMGAAYDFGPVKLFGELSRVEDRLSTIGPASAMGLRDSQRRDKYDGVLVGLTIPVGPGLIRAMYSEVKYKNGLDAIANLGRSAGGEASANKIAVGYVHNLSKRTALYASISRTRIRDGQNNPGVMGLNAGGPSGALPTGSVNGFLSTGGGVAGFAPRSATGYDFGIRHGF